MAPLLQVVTLVREDLLSVGDITLRAGECIALRGASGAGKSLLLRALVDLDPNEGEVYLEGVERQQMSASAWRRKVAYLPAESGWWAPQVLPHMSDKAGAEALLATMKLPPDALAWHVSRLSTGERQRLAMIRALIEEPRVLLLDEPTAALDQAASAAVEALLLDLLSRERAIILVTHDAAQAERLAGRTLHMNKGRLTADAAA